LGEILVYWAGLPDFSWFKNTKMGKIYQMTTNYTKRPQTIPNGHKLYQTAINYPKWPYNNPNGHEIYQHYHFQEPPKFTQIGILGLKINHLATLLLGDSLLWVVF
jgi:hypothetical protein